MLARDQCMQHSNSNMTSILMLRRSAVLSAAVRRPWGALSLLNSGPITAQQQTRGVITIKKFTREKEPVQPKKSKPSTTPRAAPSDDGEPSLPGKPMRLAKRIALAGICSRREAEKLIQAMEVTVNGKIVSELSTTVDMEKDAIVVQGRPLAKAMRRKVWMANKLPGELVTANDPQGRPTIFDRLRVMGLTHHMMPVGRLDFNTEGLLLLTNDGEYAREMEHPKTEVVRVYKVLVRGQVTPSKIDELRRGPLIDGIKYRSIHAFVQSVDKKDSWLQVRIAEGKNREIRKALAHVRLVVKRLIRVQYGPYRLADLPNGSVLEVKPKSLTFDKTKKPLGKKKTPARSTAKSDDKQEQKKDEQDAEDDE